MGQTIKSVKINAKSRLKIFLEGEVMYGEDSIFEKTIRQSFEEPSQSLLNSFKLLLPHYLIHTKHKQDFSYDYIKNGHSINDSKLDNFAVNGFTYSGDGDDEKVILHGLVFEDDKGMPISTLKIPLYNNDTYPYSAELVKDLDNLLKELQLFLEGNFKKDPQGELDFNIEEVEEEMF